MDAPPAVSPEPLIATSGAYPRGTFLTATSLSFLKPRLKRAMQPIAARLARAGVTANQVTIASIAGSMAMGALLCVVAAHRVLFAFLAIWLAARTACATLDGTLAIEFGQKSRWGSVLNEAGDIVSEIALFLPLAFVAPFATAEIILLISFAVASELAGLIGSMLGGDRRVEGPLGKADRSIVLSIIAIAISVFGGLPESASIIVPVLGHHNLESPPLCPSRQAEYRAVRLVFLQGRPCLETGRSLRLKAKSARLTFPRHTAW